MEEIIAEKKQQMQEVMEEIIKLSKTAIKLGNSADLEGIEKRVGALTDQLAAIVVGLKVQEALASAELQEESKKLIKSYPKRLKNQGPLEVAVRVLRGGIVKVKSNYYSGKDSGKASKQRGVGCYPALLLLGIEDACTPALALELSAMAVLLSSLAEANEVLANRGINLDIKTLRAVTYRMAQRVKLQQQHEGIDFGESLRGSKVVVSTDGGRVRIRKNKRGPKTKKGRPHYSTSWREPKLLIIYRVNEKGEIDRTFAPMIDGTLKGPDAIFALIAYYLTKLGVSQADKLLFIADGAQWIWNRVPKLLKSLGLSAQQVYQAIDFYHAVEHLGQVAALRKSWSAAQRKRWVKRQRKLLLVGKVQQVVDAVEELCRGRSGKAIARQRDYFINNLNRMDYANLAALGLPIGSGAIESAIRRVVNLRFKGPGIFWHRDNVEAMLTLRSYHKAGRWNLLKQMAFTASLPVAA